MKTKYYSLILMIGSLFFLACFNQSSSPGSSVSEEENEHQEHLLLADNLAHKDIIILDTKHPAPREFGDQIQTFFGSYLNLQKALVEEDTVAANQSADEMKFLLGFLQSPFTELDSKHAEVWGNHYAGYMKNLTEFLHVKTMEEKRSYFSHISEILYCTFKSFDTGDVNVHVAFCPMAFDNKGAYWLTDEHKIKNPYFGRKMLKCGKIEEIIL